MRKPNCTFCGPASTAASAPRPLAASCASGCRSGWWGEADGQILKYPNEAVRGVLTAIFEQFPARGSVRSVWLWLRDQGLQLPLSKNGYVAATDEIVWVDPTYHAVHNIFTHPAYGGAYTFGRTGQHRYVGSDGAPRVRAKPCRPATSGRSASSTTTRDSSTGTPTWPTRPASAPTSAPAAHQPGTGALREGCALLQGLVTCGICGRKLSIYYDGERKATPGYYCTGTGQLVEGRGTRHLRVGGVAIEISSKTATTRPAAWRRQVETARYAAVKAERRYRAVDPENRLSPAGWRTRGRPRCGTSLTPKPNSRTARCTPENPDTTGESGAPGPRRQPATVWDAPTTTDRDRKQPPHTLLDEVNITAHRGEHRLPSADLIVRWKGGAISELTVGLKRHPE